MNMLFMAFVTSSLIISQHALKKAPVNPSGPGALLDGMELIVFFISSCEKGTSSMDRSLGTYPSAFQSKVLVLGATEPR